MDNLANMFSTIQNGQMRKKSFVLVSFSRKNWNICMVLFIHGFIQGFEIQLPVTKNFSEIKLDTNTHQNINSIHQISDPLTSSSFSSNSYPCASQTLSTQSFTPDKPRFIKVSLKYFNEKPLITKILKISLQGKRVYAKKTLVFLPMKLEEGAVSFNGKINKRIFSLKILSTSKGILSEQDASFFGVGGEVLCEVY